MIEAYEGAKTAPAFELYGLGLAHKHVPELQRYSGLTRRPIFVPSVGNFRQGMLVSVPLHLDLLPGKPIAARLQAALERHYLGVAAQVRVRLPRKPQSSAGGSMRSASMGPTSSSCTCFRRRTTGRRLLVARLDNLGKGAAGAAVQNIRLMLGL